MAYLTVIISLLAASGAFAAPLSDDPASLEYGNFIEGDMIEPYPGAFSGLLNTANRWPGGVVVYKFDSSLSETSRTRSLTAMTKITEATGGCIKFRKATASDGSKYVLMRDGTGCSAGVGYWGREVYVNLISACSIGNIMHELQHTLGVYHQQSRPDRDSFVKIALENVKPGMENNFLKHGASQVGSFNVKYDFASQMHYTEYAFSKNGQRTIIPLPGKVPAGTQIGKRDDMSPGDIALIKSMYKC